MLKHSFQKFQQAITSGSQQTHQVLNTLNIGGVSINGNPNDVSLHSAAAPINDQTIIAQDFKERY